MISAALSTSTCLDVPAASRLAERDPALSLLPAAVASAEASGRVLHDVGWTPGTGCRLAYRAAEERGQGHGAGWRVGVGVGAAPPGPRP